MNELTSKQRAHLRKLAHDLKPVVQVGSGGCTPQVVEAVREALRTREILKVRALESAPASVGEIAANMAEGIPGLLVAGTIGRVAVLYRPDPEHPSILLPPKG